MRKILLFVAAAAMMTSCGSKGTDNGSDSLNADSTASIDSLDSADSTPDEPTLTQRSDTASGDEDDTFAISLPDPKELCLKAVSAGTTGRYITSLGFKVKSPKHWELVQGRKICRIEEKDPNYEKEGSGLSFEVTVIGDNAALENYYQKALTLQKSGFGTNYTVEKKGDTVITKEVES